MHECREFRERWADLVFESATRPPSDVFAAELESCLDCQKFFSDAAALVRMMDGADSRDLAPFGNWEGFEARLRNTLTAEGVPAAKAATATQRLRAASPAYAWLAMVAVMILSVAGLDYLSTRRTALESPPAQTAAADIPASTEANEVRLDPGTIEFLGQSEMFLRAFTKIEPADSLDLEDARTQAGLQLAGIRQREEAVADVFPVRTTLEEYESVLREIKNLDQPAAGNLSDIQLRIARKGLIADMKSYQPRIVLTTLR